MHYIAIIYGYFVAFLLWYILYSVLVIFSMLDKNFDIKNSDEEIRHVAVSFTFDFVFYTYKSKSLYVGNGHISLGTSVSSSSQYVRSSCMVVTTLSQYASADFW